MTKMTRREFLRVSAAGMAALAVSTGLSGCFADDDDQGGIPVRFTHGVASGDPMADAVLLWTRVVPDDLTIPTVRVRWEMATDADFLNLVRSGEAEVDAATDHILKVDARGLQAGQRYWYRFRSNGRTSPVGQTRTLPVDNVERVRFAVVSCANYTAGYFHVYRDIAAQPDLDAVLHLGDYLYEYGMGGYATEDAVRLGRALPADNAQELLTLADYRKRYALYRSDPDLQVLHAALPFIAVWDDHEVANDSWREGAENHDPDLGEGDFQTRRDGGLQAWFEWLPIRPVAPDDRLRIYRQFDYGNLVSLYMLDTRLIARDEQLDYLNYLDPATGSFNADAFRADLGDPNRSLLGSEQFAWLQGNLAASTARWQVLGQQVLMGQMTLPAELLPNLLQPSPAILNQFSELGVIKARIAQGDPTVSAEDRARVTTVLPYNLDAWDGYAYEREILLGTLARSGQNLVALAGDTHNGWASNLRTLSGEQAGVEFATPSVSSPGLETYLSLPEDIATVESIEAGLTLLVDQLEYINVSNRGYLITTFTPEQAQADWHYVSSVKERTYDTIASRRKSMRVLPGRLNRRLLEG